MKNMETSYPLFNVKVCLSVHDYQTSEEKETKDYIFFTKTKSLPVMIPKIDQLSVEHVIEISHQAGIPQQKFLEDLRVLKRLIEQEKC